MIIKPLGQNAPNLHLRLEVLNDTGSSVLSIRQTEANNLGITQPNYPGNFGSVSVQTASGSVNRLNVYVTACIEDGQGGVLGTPFRESAVIVPNNLSILSGDMMRDHFYFGTPKRNDMLVIALTKNALMQGLPAR